MTSKNEKKSFVMYDSFLEAMKHLNDVEFRECVLKIRNYALEGIDEKSTSSNINIIMALVKPNLDSAKRRYIASVENGKKGTEYGKLGGAPKGNQNARKKQPLNQPQKQPLDVDANDNVDVEEDVNDNEEVDVNGDDPSGSKGFQYSFSNSSIGLLDNKIENDSERFGEENKEPLKEVNPCQSNNLIVGAAGESQEEKNIYSKCDIDDSAPASTHSVEGAGCSAARTQPMKESGMDMSDYLEQCISQNAVKLAHIRKNELPQDDKLFWRTVDLYGNLYGDSKSQATKYITKLVNELIKQGVV